MTRSRGGITPGIAPTTGTTSATDTLTRLLFLAVAAAAVIFGGLTVDSFIAQGWPPYPPAEMLVWVASFALPVALGLFSRAPAPVLKAVVLIEVLLFFVAAGLWAVLPSPALPVDAAVPWTITFTGVPAVAVAVVASARVAWSYTVLAALLSGLVRFNTSPGPHPFLTGLADGLYALLLFSVFVALTLAARRAAARLDAASDIARRAESQRAARVSRRRERLTIDALVHDSVISTLLMAGLGRTPHEVVAEHAAKTLSQLDELQAPPVQPVVLVSDIVRRLTRLGQQIDPQAEVRLEAPCPSGKAIERTVPSDAVAALLGAVGEALRNSVASAAGPDRPKRPVRRTISAFSTSDGFQVTVLDDGVGFDPAAVPAERLGIAQSIIGRMQRVPGGAAHLRSQPGQGTEVVMAWAPNRAVTAAAESAAAETAGVRERRAIARRVEPPVPPGLTARPVSLARTLDHSMPLVRLILVLFFVVHAVLAAVDPVPGRSFILPVVAYLAIMAAAGWVMRPVFGPLPRVRVLGVLGLCLVGAVAMSVYLPPAGTGPFAQWHLGAITLILLMLAARGSIRSAWLGYATLAGLSVLWAVLHGLSPLEGVNAVVRHAGTLLAGTLFVVGLGRTERRLAVLTQNDLARASRDATTVAAIDEREAELRRVNALARPTLQRLAVQHPLTEHERSGCLLVEAGLRDAIRGRSLFVEPVISAVRAARQRGVEVTVLDDSADSPPAQVATLAETVAEVLATVPSGRVTVRVLPADRPIIATVVLESDTSAMLSVGPAGTLLTPA